MVSLSLSGRKHPNRSLVGEESFCEVELPLYGVLGSWSGRPCNVLNFLASNHQLALAWRVTKRQSSCSRRKGNTLGWVVWALMSVMLVCFVLWAATGAVALLFGAVLAALGVLYVVLLTNLYRRPALRLRY